VGKGLSGGRIIIRRPLLAGYAAEDNVIIGNVALYGATRGEAYINGLAGERFAVRNSGAIAVVEGVGNHGCEYMTGGTVLIIGETGYNFAAGMSGGEAFVYDEHDGLGDRLNTQMAQLQACQDPRDLQMILRLLENHYACTGSQKAANILADWLRQQARFRKVMSDAYAKVIEASRHQGRDIRTPLPPPVSQDLHSSAHVSAVR